MFLCVLKEDKNKNPIIEVITSLLSILFIYYFCVISHFIFVENKDINACINKIFLLQDSQVSDILSQFNENFRNYMITGENNILFDNKKFIQSKVVFFIIKNEKINGGEI